MQSVTSNAVSKAINLLPHSKLVTLSSGADMNDCIDATVIYYNSTTSEINTFINKPTFTGSGEMAVFTLPLGRSEYLLQIYIAKDGNNRSIAHRVYTNNTWSSWRKLATTEDTSPDYSDSQLIFNGTYAFNTNFTAPKDGYIMGSGYGTGQENNYIYFTTPNGILFHQQGTSNEFISSMIPVRKGDVVGIAVFFGTYNNGVYFVPCG